MFAPDSLATVDVLTDHGIPVVAEGGLESLSASVIAARCRCSRQAVQQWCRGRPLRTLFTERFLSRWMRWTDIRTRGGQRLERLLPENVEVVGWTRVWLSLLEAAPRDPGLADLVADALAHELALVATAVPAERVATVQALIAGMRQALCLPQPSLSLAEAQRALALALR